MQKLTLAFLLRSSESHGTQPIMKFCQHSKLFLYCKDYCFKKFWFLENKMYAIHYMINII